MLRRVAVLVLSAPVHFYRYAISPMMPPRCRFLPTCSEYTLEALRRHGPLAGGWMATRRICRCHPFNPGGIDPVPDSPSQLRAGPSRWPAGLRGDPPAE